MLGVSFQPLAQSRVRPDDFPNRAHLRGQRLGNARAEATYYFLP
jgi:hypothetical protein